MIRIIYIPIFALLTYSPSLAQVAGDYRSAGTGPSNWNSNLSWETFNGTSWVAASASPQVADGVITVRSGHTIRIINSNEIVDQVVVDGTLLISATYQIDFPGAVSGDAITVNGTLDNSGTIVMQTTPVIRMTGAGGGVGTYIARQASVISNATVSNLRFDAGSTYQHGYTTTAGTIPLATWNVTSTCLIKGYSTNTAAPGNLNQTFGNVTLDVLGGSTSLGGALTTVKGNFTTALTNTRAWTLSSATTYTLNVEGDFVVNAGNFLIAPTAAIAMTINVSKDLKYIGGSITKSGGLGSVTFVFNGSVAQNLLNITPRTFVGGINFNVLAGSTLDLGVSSLTGTGTFTLNSGATLQLGSLNGSGALVGASGNIRVSGLRTYSSGSTIIYNGSAAQFMGTGQPSGTGITTIINNAAGVTLASTPLSLNGNLTLQSGDFTTSGRDLTLGGVFTANANNMIADVGTSLTINDTGSTADFGLLKLTGTSVIGNLTIGGSVGRTVKLGSDLGVTNFTQTIGDFQLNGFTLNIQGAISQAGGTLTSSASSGLNISEETGGVLPADLLIAGGSIGTITMNRTAETLITSSALTVTNLNLSVGTFTHTGSLQMATNGKISVASGILTNPVAAVSTYNVEYYGTDPIATSAELPVSSTILTDLTNLKTAVVTLSAAATINGSLILTDGTFDSGGQQVTLNGNFLSNALSDFSLAPIIFNGATSISGTVAPQFGDVTINNTKSLAINSTLQINVASNFTNNGTFTSNQSNVLLNGSNSQVLSGSSSTSFYGLEIDKAGFDVTVQNNVDIENVLNIKSATNLVAGTNLLRLVSTASRTARVNPLPDLADITGSVIVERYLPNGSSGRAYRYLTPSVTTTNVEDWRTEVPVTGTFTDPSTGTGITSTAPSLYYYDETVGGAINSRYKNYPVSGTAASAALTNGLGYALFVRSASPIVVDSRGTLAQHQKTITVTAQSTNSMVDGWNLIGNPYPSPVLWSKVTQSVGVDNAIYTRDNTNLSGVGAGNFVTFIGGVSTPAGFKGIIESGQGFWVHTQALSGTVTFNETDKISSTDSVGVLYRQKSDVDLLRLFVEGTSGKDEIVVRFADEATDNFDSRFDALKLPNDKLNLASKSIEGKEMTINTLGALTCQRNIALSMSNVLVGSHSLKVTGIESFGSDVDLILKDNLTSNSVDLRTITEYVFTVTTDNLSSIGTRFVLEVGKSRILKKLPVSSESVCFGNSISSVTITTTQPEIEYRIFLKKEIMSDWMAGNGDNLSFNVSAKNLNSGDNFFTVLARNSCTSDSLESKPLIQKFAELKITDTVDGVICKSGDVTLQAAGANAGEMYNWYTSQNDAHPVKVESEGKLLLENLIESTTYYVSTTNSLGCESEKVKLSATLIDYEDVFITEVGNVLVSNYLDGNKWYYNGSYLANETTNKLTVTESGLYSVQVTISGCVSEASIIQTITNLEENAALNFTIFPNPTSDEVSIHFGANVSGLAYILVVSSSGLPVHSEKLQVNQNVNHRISLGSFAPGVYVIRIIVGDQIHTTKIIKQ